MQELCIYNKVQPPYENSKFNFIQVHCSIKYKYNCINVYRIEQYECSHKQFYCSLKYRYNCI